MKKYSIMLYGSYPVGSPLVVATGLNKENALYYTSIYNSLADEGEVYYIEEE